MTWKQFRYKLFYINRWLWVIGLNVLILGSVNMLGCEKAMANTLLLPEFKKIQPDYLANLVIMEILNTKKIVENITKNSEDPSWNTLIQPLEDAGAKLENAGNLLSHLHAVKDSPELRVVYTKVLQQLADLHVEFYQNKLLQQKILKLAQAKEFKQLTIAQQKVIQEFLLDFKLAGIELPATEQARYKEISKSLSELSDQFAKNVLDATQGWEYCIAKDPAIHLAGLPEYFIAAAKQLAVERGKPEGWLITLDLPTVDLVLRYAKDRNLREIIYRAQVTKASEQADPQLVKFDNSKIMLEICSLRQELAKLLGYKNYAEYSLIRKMAKSTQAVTDFLQQLAARSLPFAKQEFAKLSQFAKQLDQLNELQPWDLSYYAEKYKESLFKLSREELRNYFQLDRVLAGIFNLANKLYGINIVEVLQPNTWNDQVKLYQVTDQTGKLRGYFYIDLYVRENKQPGAWMANCRSRHKWQTGELQVPVAFLITNFSKPSANNAPVLLYHDELITLLHEFGHTLQHILTQVDHYSLAGCNGVAWDVVELPSQFMEKWGYDHNFLQTVALHLTSKQPLPRAVFENLVGIRDHQAGMFMTRQLEFGMFDFNLHLSSAEPVIKIQEILDQVRSKVTVVPVVKFNRYQNSFSHIFSGGYAAGYYSYNWAEVLACDAFMAFQALKSSRNDEDAEQAATAAIAKLGQRFLTTILETGGTRDPLALYLEFRGQIPTIEALFTYKGLHSQN